MDLDCCDGCGHNWCDGRCPALAGPDYFDEDGFPCWDDIAPQHMWDSFVEGRL